MAQPQSELTKPSKRASGNSGTVPPEPLPETETGDGIGQPSAHRPLTAAEIFADMEKVREAEAAPLIETVEVLVAVSARRPKPLEWFRVHPDPTMQMEISIFEDPEEQQVYYVHGPARSAVGERLRKARLMTCINRAGVVFLWPIKQPQEGASGGQAWNASALRAATFAQTKWIRLIGELKNGQYKVQAALSVLPDPTWPEHTLQEYVILAFEGKVIDRPEHDVIQRRILAAKP